MTGVIPLLPQENIELASQLKRLESSFSIFAEESNPNQLLAHLGRMAVEFHHLSSKVQKNEQRTSLLQVCNTLGLHDNTPKQPFRFQLFLLDGRHLKVYYNKRHTVGSRFIE